MSQSRWLSRRAAASSATAALLMTLGLTASSCGDDADDQETATTAGNETTIAEATEATRDPVDADTPGSQETTSDAADPSDDDSVPQGDSVPEGDDASARDRLLDMYVDDGDVTEGWTLHEAEIGTISAATSEPEECQPVADALAGIAVAPAAEAAVVRYMDSPSEPSRAYSIQLVAYETGRSDASWDTVISAVLTCESLTTTGAEGTGTWTIADAQEVGADLGDGAVAFDAEGQFDGADLRADVLLVRVGPVVIHFTSLGNGTADVPPIPEPVARAQIAKVTEQLG